MDRFMLRTGTVALVLLVFIVGQVVAVPPPKAKNAENSIRVDAPAELVEIFEDHGVDLSGFVDLTSVDRETSREIQSIYSDNGGVINGIALAALARAYDDVGVPVYMEFGPLYWGHWRPEDNLYH